MICELSHDDIVNWANFSPDGTKIITASNNSTIKVWDLANMKPGESTELFTTENVKLGRTGKGDIQSANFSSDGTKILTVFNVFDDPDTTAESATQVWDFKNRKKDEPLFSKSHTFDNNSAKFSPDGKQIVMAYGESTITIINSENGNDLLVIGEEDGDNSEYLANFSTDGKKILTVSLNIVEESYQTNIWDVKTQSGQLIAEHKLTLNHNDWIWSANFSPKGDRILTASEDKSFKVWDAESGEEIFKGIHGEKLTMANFSPDGEKVVAGSRDNTAKIWDLDNSENSSQPISLTHNNFVHIVEFTPDGTKVVTTCLGSNEVKVWNAQTGEFLWNFSHNGEITSINFLL